MRFFVVLAILSALFAQSAAVLRTSYVPSHLSMPVPKNGPTPQDCSVSCGDGTCCPSGYICCKNADTCCPDDYKCSSDGQTCSKSDSSCFSGKETVTLSTGEDIPISQLKIGDKVLSYADGKFGFTDVVFLPHAKNDEFTKFVDIKLASGKEIKMTIDHLLPAAASKDGSASLLRAEQLKVGQFLTTVNGPDAVKSVDFVMEHGIYTMVTQDEYIVVNGIVASPFGVNHYMTNKFYNIHRTVYNVYPQALESENLKVREATLALGAAMLHTVGSK